MIHGCAGVVHSTVTLRPRPLAHPPSKGSSLFEYILAFAPTTVPPIPFPPQRPAHVGSDSCLAPRAPGTEGEPVSGVPRASARVRSFWARVNLYNLEVLHCHSRKCCRMWPLYFNIFTTMACHTPLSSLAVPVPTITTASHLTTHESPNIFGHLSCSPD